MGHPSKITVWVVLSTRIIVCILCLITRHVQENRGFVSDLMNIRGGGRSRTRSTLQQQGRRINQSRPHDLGGRNDSQSGYGDQGGGRNGGRNGGSDLNDREQRDLKNLKHSGGDMGVHFTNGKPQDVSLKGKISIT